MKKTFVIQVEYPDNDVIPSEEVMEVAQECIERSMGRYFGANIMDGDYDRIKVKEVTDGFTIVKRMREAQIEKDESDQGYRTMPHICILEKKDKLESEVDEYLKKMEDGE